MIINVYTLTGNGGREGERSRLKQEEKIKNIYMIKIDIRFNLCKMYISSLDSYKEIHEKIAKY